MKPYLIQRCNIKLNQGRQGIDDILRFDYMGSAEFEWGALPKSLKRLRYSLDQYEVTQFNIGEVSIKAY